MTIFRKNDERGLFPLTYSHRHNVKKHRHGPVRSVSEPAAVNRYQRHSNYHQVTFLLHLIIIGGADLADFLGVYAAEAAAEHCEVLAEDEDGPAEHRAAAGDDAVARHLLLRHPEVRAGVLGERVILDKGADVAQQLDALSSGELTLRTRADTATS